MKKMTMAALPVAAALALSVSACSSSSSSSTQSSSPATSTSASATPAPSGSAIPAAQLQQAFANTTHIGTYEGETFAEFYEPNGTILYLGDNGTETGSWVIRGDKACFAYPSDPSVSGELCYDEIIKDGNFVYWIADGNVVATSVELSGNSLNLTQ